MAGARKYFTAALAALALLAGLIAVPAKSAQALDVEDFYFSDFSVDYYLMRDDEGISRMKVVETFTAEFPNFDQNKGIVRVIPRNNQRGRNRVLQDLNITVTRNGQPENIYSQERDNDNFYISTGTEAFLRGRQVYQFTYEFERVITEFSEGGENWQELFWDTNGTDGRQRIDNLSVRLHLANDIAGAFTGDTVCFVGAFGVDGRVDCDQSASGNVVSFVSRRALRAGENLTFGLMFEPGTFTVPEQQASHAPFVAGIGSAAAALVALVFCGRAYRKKISKAKKRNQQFLVPEYLPPRGVSVGGAAYIYDTHSQAKSVTAQLLDLAIRGKIRLIETPKKGLFKGKQKDYSYQVLDESGLHDDEVQLLTALNFGKAAPRVGDAVELTQAQSNLSFKQALLVQNRQEALLKLPRTNYNNLAHGGFMQPKESKLALGLIGTGIGVNVVGGAVVAAAIALAHENLQEIALFGGVVAALAAMIGMGVAIIVLGARSVGYENLTDKGYRMRHYLLGLEEYIKFAEADRIKFLQGPKTAEKIDTSDSAAMVKLCEKLLPYAVIFGQEKQWAKTLQVYYDNLHQAPVWYQGTGVFQGAMLASAIGGLSSSMTQSYGGGSGSFSSGVSGFGGGGFSGLGGGGGGFGGR